MRKLLSLLLENTKRIVHPAPVERVNSVPLVAIMLGLFLLGAGVRIAFVVIRGDYKVIETPEMVLIAKSLAASGYFANPFPTPTGPTAISPPGYPFLLSLIFRTLGFDSRSQLFIQCMTSAVAALQFALLPWFAICLGFTRNVGIYAGALGAAIPFWFWTETKGSYDTALTSLLLMLLIGIFGRCVMIRRSGLPKWYGLLWGVTLLFAPSFGPALLFLCFLRIVLARWRREGMRDVAWTCAMAALVLTPWTIRNYLEFHKIFFVRDNFGLELAISNNDLAHPLFDDNIGFGGPYAHHPFRDANQASYLRRVGEISYFDMKKAEAFEWIRNHTGRFAQLTLRRFVAFWFPILNQPSKTIFSAAWTIAGLCGFLLAWRNNRIAACVLSSVFIIYPLVYYLIQVDIRYRYPLYAPLLLVGVYGISRLGSGLFART